MVIAAKISSKRQITIPLKVMVRLKLNPGDQLVFEEKNGHMEIKPKIDHFTVEDFIKKYAGKTKKRLTDEEIRIAREEFWGHKEI